MHQCTSSSGGRGGSTAASSNLNNSSVSVSHDALAPACHANTNPAPSNALQQIKQLGRFFNAGKTAICSDVHTTAFIGVLQLAINHRPGGIHGALGHNNKTAWIRNNIAAFFAADGPIGMFHAVTPKVFMRHLNKAQTLAWGYYRCDHSNEPSVAGQEDVPHWASKFFGLFEVGLSQPTNNALAAAARSERRYVCCKLDRLTGTT